MAFIPGNIVKEYEVDGKKVRLRYPKWEDLDDLLKCINNMVAERSLLGRQKKVSRKDEIDWLANSFKAIEKNDVVMIVSEVDGKVIGNSIITREEMDSKKHVGMFGIGLKKEYRRMGIGKDLLESVISIARKEMGIKIVQLWCFAGNHGAINLYNNTGFKEVGRIPKGLNNFGKYDDEVLFYREV